jgi:hypothetical protein
VSGGGATTIEQFVLVVSEVPEVESVTVAVKLKVPGVVGVPVIAPLLVLSVSPPGNAPTEIENAYGGVPPAATKDEL